jgi:hypothetical protein
MWCPRHVITLLACTACCDLLRPSVHPCTTHNGSHVGLSREASATPDSGYCFLVCTSSKGLRPDNVSNCEVSVSAGGRTDRGIRSAIIQEMSVRPPPPPPPQPLQSLYFSVSKLAIAQHTNTQQLQTQRLPQISDPFRINTLKYTWNINIQKLRVLGAHSVSVSPVRYELPTVYLCVPYGSHRKQRLFPHTALTGWAL